MDSDELFPVAMSQYQAGRLAEAERICDQILETEPRHAEALNLRGILAVRAGKPDLGVKLIRQAIGVSADNPVYFNNLGLGLRASGQLDEAILACRKAIELNSNFGAAFSNLGIALKDKARYDEAISCFEKAILLRPQSAEPHNGLGVALQQTGKLELAIESFRRAVKFNPRLVEAHANLGNALMRWGQLDEALLSCQEAIRLRPELGDMHRIIADIRNARGECDEAVESYREALRLKPGSAEIHSALIFGLHFCAECDQQVIGEELSRWNQRHAEPLVKLQYPHDNARDPRRRLRIGYVSPDFRRHSVAYFFEYLLEFRDRQSFQTFCYFNSSSPDETTARLQGEADEWRDIATLADSAVADLIRKDGIDILVDLSGHTAGNRLPVFAMKPAPVQATYMGYPNTTGLRAMAYRLTDARADPPGENESLYSEKLLRLPRTFLCYRANQNAPPVGVPPVSSRGFITFGSFNTLQKINAPLVRLWAQVLRQAPNSRMILKTQYLKSAVARQRILKLFSEEQILAARIELFGAVADENVHLQFYDRVDIALDTFPYHGTTTTCEAMWMGVPTVTLAGNMHMSRVGVSLSRTVGLDRLIASSPEEYVRIALQMANDVPGLGEMRRTMRERMQGSPLMDAAGFVREMEGIYRKMWEAWCH